MVLNTPSFADLIAELDFSQGESLGLSNQGEVRRFKVSEHDLAIKQPKGRGLAWTIRAATLRHEHRAYERLQGLPGIPKCHGLFPGDRLVLEYVKGTTFRGAGLDSSSPVFVKLLTLIQGMHARGVAHGDLKRKDNLLIDEQGSPIILDFGTSTLEKSGKHPVNRRLFRFICQTDINAWVKLKYGGYENLSADDEQLLQRTGIERALSRWRQG